MRKKLKESTCGCDGMGAFKDLKGFTNLNNFSKRRFTLMFFLVLNNLDENGKEL